MKAFWKESSGMIGKMIINQLGMMIFGLIVCTATAKNGTLLVCASVFSVLFYLVLLYIMTWELGAKDHVRVAAGRYPNKPLRGVQISLAANVPNLLLALCAILGKAIAVAGTSLSFFTTPGTDVFAVTGSNFAYNLYSVTWNIGLFLQSMYTGVIRATLPNCPLILLIVVLPALCASGLGYFLGLHDVKLSRVIFGRKPQTPGNPGAPGNP